MEKSKEVSSKKEFLYLVIALLSIIALLGSIGVFLQQQGNETAAGICSALGTKEQCDVVSSSSYAKLFGFPNSILGLIGFSLMIVFSYWNYSSPNFISKMIVAIGSLIAGALAIFFLLVQAIELKAFCVYCVVVDVVSIVMLAIVLFDFTSGRGSEKANNLKKK